MWTFQFFSALFAVLFLLPCLSVTAKSVQSEIDVRYVSAGVVGDLNDQGVAQFYFWAKSQPGDRSLKIHALIFKDGVISVKVFSNAESIAVSNESHWTTRDTSTQLLSLGDFDGDKNIDIITSSGILLDPWGKSQWINYSFVGSVKDDEFSFSSPAVYVKDKIFGQANSVLIAGQYGHLYQCGWVDGGPLCETRYVDLQGYIQSMADIAVGDFDGDHQPDFIMGYLNTFFDQSIVFYSRQVYSPLIVGVSAADYAVGDVNGDGIDDLVAQVSAKISDFPSYTQIFLGAESGLFLYQTFNNFDNHNDNSELADVNGDGCLDYLQIGVDSSAVGFKPSTKDGKSCRLDIDALWKDHLISYTPPMLHSGIAPGAFGVQVFDLDNDGTLEIFLRFGWADWSAQKNHLSLLQYK